MGFFHRVVKSVVGASFLSFMCTEGRLDPSGSAERRRPRRLGWCGVYSGILECRGFRNFRVQAGRVGV